MIEVMILILREKEWEESALKQAWIFGSRRHLLSIMRIEFTDQLDRR
jgi:hypothetical protein